MKILKTMDTKDGGTIFMVLMSVRGGLLCIEGRNPIKIQEET